METWLASAKKESLLRFQDLVRFALMREGVGLPVKRVGKKKSQENDPRAYLAFVPGTTRS